jgi:hypothetical protein
MDEKNLRMAHGRRYCSAATSCHLFPVVVVWEREILSGFFSGFPTFAKK